MSQMKRRAVLPLLMICAASAVVSSCASKVETHLALPPVADLRQVAEPVFPVAALDACPEGTTAVTCPATVAETKWHDAVLKWGRTGWAQNKRVCQWAVDLGLAVPAGYCSK